MATLIRLFRSFCLVLAVAGIVATPAAAFDPKAYEVVDLTHTFDAKTLYWPNSPSTFEWKSIFAGKTEGGFFYSAGAFCAPEHGGTHLDAPIHFAEGKIAADAVPVADLIAAAIVIDVSAKTASDPDYRLTAEDVAAFEQQHGPIPAGAIVLLRTGWSSRYPDRKAYFGDDKPGDVSNLHFPSYGAEAARVLVEQRKVAALGVDTPSIDYGQSKDFVVHQISAAQNVAGLENLNSLERLPPTGSVVLALPMKIGGGTGAPLRAVALLPKP